MQSSFSFFILLLVGLFSESKKIKKQTGGEYVSYEGLTIPDVSQPDLASESMNQIQGDPITMNDAMDAIKNPESGSKGPMLLFAFSLVGFFSVIGLVGYKIYQRVSYV